MKVSNNMNFTDKYIYYKEELLKIINQPIKEYNLSIPTLCHGYSSVISIQISVYRETKDKRFLESLERNVIKLLKEHKEIKLEKDNLGYNEDFSLLEGVGGVTLTLLSIISSDINYFKLLMID